MCLSVCFLALQYEAAVVGGGRDGEEVGVASVGKVEASAQLCHGHGEVAHSDIGFVECAELGGVLFAESVDVGDSEDAPGECVDEMAGEEEVGVGVELVNVELLRHLVEELGLHDGGVGLVEVVIAGVK